MRRVLLVDDDDGVLDSLKRMFEVHGCDVHALTNPRQAIDLANDLVGPWFDVVVLDYDFGLAYDGRTGVDLAVLLRSMCPGSFVEPTRYIIFSGLTREVPPGIEFVSKDRLDDLLKMVVG